MGLPGGTAVFYLVHSLSSIMNHDPADCRRANFAVSDPNSVVKSPDGWDTGLDDQIGWSADSRDASTLDNFTPSEQNMSGEEKAK
jgi:hypothetical protein